MSKHLVLSSARILLGPFSQNHPQLLFPTGNSPPTGPACSLDVSGAEPHLSPCKLPLQWSRWVHQWPWIGPPLPSLTHVTELFSSDTSSQVKAIAGITSPATLASLCPNHFCHLHGWVAFTQILWVLVLPAGKHPQPHGQLCSVTPFHSTWTFFLHGCISFLCSMFFFSGKFPPSIIHFLWNAPWIYPWRRRGTMLVPRIVCVSLYSGCRGGGWAVAGWVSTIEPCCQKLFESVVQETEEEEIIGRNETQI